ncbi:hypothetical protein F4776DRAFT_677389 [Hypoxylon sp. NC0597]|nr:hypothetical protein F4776DRAFT_677389 [Hypoxylon sp. NC0597]
MESTSERSEFLQDDKTRGFFTSGQTYNKPHKSYINRELVVPGHHALGTREISITSKSTDSGPVDVTCAVQHPSSYLSDKKRALAEVAFSLFVLYLHRHKEVAGYWNTLVVETALGTPKGGAVPEAVDGVGTGNTSTTSTGTPHSSALPFSGSSKYHRNSGRHRGKGDGRDRPGRRREKRLPVPNVPGRADTSGSLWACPFYVRNGEEHWRCLDFKLKRIVDVRQHIYRKHVLPVHCPTCGVEFAHEYLRVEHIIASFCEPRQFNLSGAAADQLEAMSRAARDGNASTEEERWFEIWMILFPGIARPESPYIPSGLSTYTCLINQYRHSTRFQQRVISSMPGNGSAQTENIMAGMLNDLSLYFTERQTDHIQSGTNETANAEDPPSLIMTSPPPSTTFSQTLPESLSHPPLESSIDAFNSPQTQEQNYMSSTLQDSYQATQFPPNENLDPNFNLTQDFSDPNWPYDFSYNWAQ